MSVESCILISVVLSSCAVKLSEGYESKSCKTSLLLFAISRSSLAEHPTYSFFFFFFFFFAVYNVQWLSSHFKRTKRPQFLKEKFVHTETKFTGSRHKLPHFCVHFFIIFIFILTGFPSRLSLLVIYVLEVELQV